MLIKKRANKKLGSLAISQIILLILGTIAVAYIIGSEIKIVSAAETWIGYIGVDDIKNPTRAIENIGKYSSSSTSPTTKHVAGATYYTKISKEGATYLAKSDKWSYWYGGKWIKYKDYSQKTFKIGENYNNIKTELDGIISQFTQEVISTKIETATEEAPRAMEDKRLTEMPGTFIPTSITEPAVSGYGRGPISAQIDREGAEAVGITIPSGPTGDLPGYTTPITKGAEGVGAAGAFPTEKALILGKSATVAGYIINSFIVAVATWSTLQGIKAALAGMEAPEWAVEAVDSASWAISGGWLAGRTTAFFISKLAGAAAAGPAGWIVGGITGVIIFFATFKLKEQKAVIFECLPWQAQTKGENCKECGKNGLPCSEYQCKSLGQGCQLLNDEKSGEAVCVWVNRQDTQYPIIEPDEEALLDPVFYKYKPDRTLSPPDRGVLISYENAKTIKTIGSGTQKQTIGCAPTFTPLRFGINISEPAICKIDPVRKNNFDEMGFFMSNGIFKEKHSYTLSLPSLEALEAEGIKVKSGDMELYIRCQDANGNSNPATFVFKFCVDEGPDETPPEIVTTDLINNMPVASGTQSLEINVYVNEPLNTANGGCKWNHNDMNYENMENNMTSCITSASSMNSQGLYSCKANLSGIKDGLDNNFYFRCKDTAGNINKESYEFVITGTQPLVIDSAKPNATTIKEATSPVKVTLEVRTSAGYNDGAATCFYSDTGDENDYSMFLNTGTYQHSHELWLAGEPGGKTYTYYIKCVDLGGNSDYETITFDVETDTDEPIVTRVYHEDTYLKLITDEEAECVYDVVSCSYDFKDGIKMTALDETTHYTDWATDRNFYIKCQDVFGNKPNPNECNIIIRPQIYF